MSGAADPILSRRQLLRGGLFGKLADVAAARVTTVERAVGAAARAVSPKAAPVSRTPLPVLRPPGAVPEREFLAGCTRCDACATACPYHAIVPAPDRFRDAAGTPMIDPMAAACHMCPDAPCITACVPAVLRKDRPMKMGTAVIQTWNCLAHRNSTCTVCSEQCPVEGAITLDAGRPHINSAACTGCGVCQYACPAPQNAVMILPLRDRPHSNQEAAA